MKKIPIYKADKLGSDGEAIGYYAPKIFHFQKGAYRRTLHEAQHLIMTTDCGFFSIDIDTLKVSFDNGDTWEDLDVN